MTMKQSLGQVAFSLSYLMVYVISMDDAQREGFVDYPTSVSKILSLMADYGLQKKNAMGRQNKNQYLVATMLTADELDEARHWKMDKLLSLGNGRLQLYLNERVTDPIKTEKKGEQRHGEISFIYFEVTDSVDELKKRLPIKSNKRIPGDPYLILYSYYIPCACIPTCNFNCAEELGKFARLHSKDMFTIVGYSAVYERTDKKNAEVFMKEGGISMFQDLTEKNERFDAVNVITNTNGKPMNGTFQELLQQCLIGHPVSSCIPDETKERIVTAFINYIMLPWFNAAMYFGKLSRMSKKDLLKSLETKLTHSIRKVSCDKMHRTPMKCRFLIKGCVESALDQTHSLAYPTFGAIRHDKPIEDTVYWRNAEALSRGFYFVNDFVEVPDCENKLHSITSLCISKAETNCENGYNTLPDRTGSEFNNEEQNRFRGASGGASRLSGLVRNIQSGMRRIMLCLRRCFCL